MQKTLTQTKCIALMLLAMCSGCSSPRSFFQMSSDAPLPFFGFDFTLPSKLGSVEKHNVQETDGVHEVPVTSDFASQQDQVAEAVAAETFEPIALAATRRDSGASLPADF